METHCKKFPRICYSISNVSGISFDLSSFSLYFRMEPRKSSQILLGCRYFIYYYPCYHQHCTLWWHPLCYRFHHRMYSLPRSCRYLLHEPSSQKIVHLLIINKNAIFFTHILSNIKKLQLCN